MSTEQQPLLQDQPFEQLVNQYGERVQTILTDLWNDCIDKSEADLQNIIKAFKPQLEKFRGRLNLAKIENGNNVSETVMSAQKKYPSTDFKTITVSRFNSKTGEEETNTMYQLKHSIGSLNVDKYTLKEINKAKENFSEDVKEFLSVAGEFRENQAKWNDFKKNPEKYSPDEFGQLLEKYREAEKAYDAALEKIGISRERFDSAGTDIKAYIKGLQDKKKGEISELSARVQVLQAEIKIVTALINKKRGNQTIERVRADGNINTSYIDNDVIGMVELPEDSSRVPSIQDTTLDQIPNIA